MTQGTQPLRRGDEIVLTIDDAAFEGKSIGRIEGFVVFVDGGVPGDRVRVKISRVKKQYAEARLLSVEQPSSMRVSPVCEHFGTCGGCRWQHVGYEHQLAFKQRHVVDALERIGGLKDFAVEPILGCEQAFWYRNKMEYSFAAQEWHNLPTFDPNVAPGVHLGLHVPQRYDKALNIGTCHLQSEVSNAILAFTREFARESGLPVYSSDANQGFWRFLVIREGRRTKERMVNIVTFEDNPDMMAVYARELRNAVPEITTIVNTRNRTKSQIAYGTEESVLFGDGTIREKLGKFEFTVSTQSFFQTNSDQAEKLYQTAAEFAEFRPDDVVYDLYSGTGTIAIYISDRVRRVVGVESVALAVRDAEANARHNAVTNCRFVAGDLKERLLERNDWISEEGPARVVIADPPRSGMHPDVVTSLIKLQPERIVYVSCNPTTQARDCAGLVAGGYRLEKIRPVDMFPHTYHVENVALLTRT